MSITSSLNIGLPAAPLADDPTLNGELQVIYNALRIMAQALNDAGIPSGGATPSPTLLDVANGGTGASTLTGIVKASGTSAFTAITSSTAGHILSCTGANTYAFAAPAIGTNVNIADAAGDTTCWILMVGGGATGSQPVLSDTGLTYNATTNALSATTFIGALTGIASGNLVSGDIGVSVQAYDADLTTWAGITPGAGVGTFLATPSSANLRAALTDETGTGAAVFANAPSFATGIGIGATAAGAGGVAFPSTAVAVSDPNTLDDYEENTWTPVLKGATTTTYNLQVGRYTKIGRTVFIYCDLWINSLGDGSTTLITGLPFTTNATGSPGNAVNYFGGLALNTIFLTAAVDNGSTDIRFIEQAASGATMTSSAAIFGSGARVRFSLNYDV
jgi:hypothetical protein